MAIHHSKLLSLVLRHKPELIGISLDLAGWTDVSELIQAIQTHKIPEFTHDDLVAIVNENDKQRFEFNAAGTKIRACQGHSVKVDLGYKVVTPPFSLYHGTTAIAANLILESGIKKGKRHAVHLSDSVTTASKVGERRGDPVILLVESRHMWVDGHLFYQSTNGVWLTEYVPPKYVVGMVPEE